MSHTVFQPGMNPELSSYCVSAETLLSTAIRIAVRLKLRVIKLFLLTAFPLLVHLISNDLIASQFLLSDLVF